ncbi:MAG: heavy metal translocating P-type ATPase, partial [Sphingobacteriales bacterium]
METTKSPELVATAAKAQEVNDHEREHAGHDHVSGGIFGERTELIFALICGGFLAAGFALSFVNGLPRWLPLTLYAGAYLFGGFYTTREAINGIRKGAFDIDFLMLVAAAGAAILG